MRRMIRERTGGPALNPTGACAAVAAPCPSAPRDRGPTSVAWALPLCPLVALVVACGSPDDKPSPGDRVAPAPVAGNRATRVLAVPDYQAKIGTAHPVRVVAGATNGRWLVACQARADTNGKDGIKVSVGTDSLEGDAMVPYVFRGGGAGEQIEALLATSPDERWLAVLRDDQLLVIDDANGTETVIRDADLRRDRIGVGHLASFTDDSQRLVYFHRVHDTRRVVIRELAQGSERELEFPRVTMLQVEPEPKSRWAHVWFLRDQIDPDPRADGPAARRSEARLETCDGHESNRFEGGPDDDGVHGAWLQLDSGVLREDASVVTHIDGLDVTKAADRAIRLGAEVIVPATCDAEVLAVAAAPPRILARCTAKQANPPVEMFGPGVHAVLGPGRLMREAVRPVRRLDMPYVCTDAAGCFALRDGKPIPVRGYVHAETTAKLVTEERNAYFLVDIATGVAEPLGVTGHGWGARSSNLMAFGTAIVDLEDGRVLGDVASRPIAVDVTGRALLSSGRPAGDELASGPLWWTAPTPRCSPP